MDLIWNYVDLGRFTWIYMDLDLDLCGFTLIYIFSWIYIDSHRFMLILLDLHAFSWIYMDLH